MLKFTHVKISRDLSYLYNIMCITDQQSLISRQINIASFESFEHRFIEDLKYFYHVFFVVQNEKEENIGFVYSYDHRTTDGNCSIVVYIDKDYQTTGAGIESSMRFMDYLFKVYPINKIYTHIYQYNEQSLLCNRQAGFSEEGCLKNYRYHNGKYWDLYILSMERERFYCTYEKYL